MEAISDELIGAGRMIKAYSMYKKLVTKPSETRGGCGLEVSFLSRFSPSKDVDVGQPSHALQPGRVDEPSGLPSILWPLTSHKILHTCASTSDKLFLFYARAYSICGIIRWDTPFGEGGKRGGKR